MKNKIIGMQPRFLTILAAFGMVTTISLVVTPNAVSKDNGKVTDIRNQSFDDFAKQIRGGYESFKDSVKKDYETFRDSINAEYALFMRSPWAPSNAEKQHEAPADKEIGPIIISEEEEQKPLNTQKLNIEKVLDIIWPTEQPEPVSPIKEMPVEKGDYIEMSFYGTPFSIRPVDLSSFHLNGNDVNSFADGWEILSQYTTNNLITDCLKIRNDLNLPDWGYVRLLDMISARLTEENTNEHRLLQGFLLNQSGYKVRFAYDGHRQLHLLFACPGRIYDKPRYSLGKEFFYSYTHPLDKELHVCNFSTPGEKAIDLGINKSPSFSFSPASNHIITVVGRNDLNLSVTANKNLIDFYNDYPWGSLDSSPYTFVIHGNTPVSKEIKEQLYPKLRKAIEGQSEYSALQLLLKVAQSFEYGLDEDIWGRDRAFWMEESWVYPKSDCEDHAINFTHMVRDLLDLDVCFIYYPGHLSSCVAVTDTSIPGDYIMYDGKKYLVCDPTCFYSRAGRTPNGSNNDEAILIPLRKLN